MKKLSLIAILVLTGCDAVNGLNNGLGNFYEQERQIQQGHKQECHPLPDGGYQCQGY